jgi:HTH-type transcriptional regulator/antitoxin HigA
MSHNTPVDVFPPGEFLREEIDARNWSQVDLAQIIGKSPAFVNELLSGKRGVTLETAQLLSDALGTSPELWMNLETAFRLSRSNAHDSRVVRRAKLYSKSPINEMTKRGWIRRSDDVVELEQEVLKFFEIDSLDDEPSLFAAARKSTAYDETTPAQLAWFYRTKKIAQTINVAGKYRKELLANKLSDIRALAIAPEEIRKLPQLLSSIGIRLVVVEHLPKTKLDGAAFWLSDREPVIAISMRYDRIDAFWHSFTHELAHIYSGDGQMIDSCLVGSDSQKSSEKPEIEQRADKMACAFLIPPDELDSFILRVRPLYSKVRIIQFANKIMLHPGIVIGQLQHRDEIGYQHSREMLVKVRDIVTSAAITDGWGSIPESAERL